MGHHFPSKAEKQARKDYNREEKQRVKQERQSRKEKPTRSEKKERSKWNKDASIGW